IPRDDRPVEIVREPTLDHFVGIRRRWRRISGRARISNRRRDLSRMLGHGIFILSLVGCGFLSFWQNSALQITPSERTPYRTIANSLAPSTPSAVSILPSILTQWTIFGRPRS